MSNKTILTEKVVKHFLDGCNCAQSVLLTMAEYWKCKDESIPKIAAAFGGGGCVPVCGALIGGVMSIGIRYGTNELLQEKQLKVNEIAQRFYEQFKKVHGSIFCRELIGYDLLNPKELEEAQNARAFEKKCTKYLKTAVELLLTLSEI
ncbi:MAG: C-GCAxxG-C-C family protein [Candidatus Bathyarchaeia archaeon]